MCLKFRMTWPFKYTHVRWNYMFKAVEDFSLNLFHGLGS